jgi:hypothetical protein
MGSGKIAGISNKIQKTVKKTVNKSFIPKYTKNNKDYCAAYSISRRRLLPDLCES